jgi:hypothetical protein
MRLLGAWDNDHIIWLTEEFLFIRFGLNIPGLEPTIDNTRFEHASITPLMPPRLEFSYPFLSAKDT